MNIVAIDTARIQPNDYNPNSMTPEAFEELCQEVQRLGQIAKPVIVRPGGEGYVIVDGEHNWRAARQIGMAQVPCEVVEIDDFESMRQTYKRNQHGRMSPTKQGRMFQRMMETRNLSQRALSAEIGVSEGTVRNSLLYVKLSEVRNDYAVEDIDRMTVQQVREHFADPSEAETTPAYTSYTLPDLMIAFKECCDASGCVPSATGMFMPEGIPVKEWQNLMAILLEINNRNIKNKDTEEHSVELPTEVPAWIPDRGRQAIGEYEAQGLQYTVNIWRSAQYEPCYVHIALISSLGKPDADDSPAFHLETRRPVIDTQVVANFTRAGILNPESIEWIYFDCSDKGILHIPKTKAA